MNNEKVTLDSILKQLETWVEQKHPISKQVWLDAAAKLNMLRTDLDDEIAELKFNYTKLDSKARRVTEAIRIAKKRAELQEFTD